MLITSLMPSGFPQTVHAVELAVQTPAIAVELAHDTAMGDAINTYRRQNGLPPLTLSYQLAYVAAHRVQLTMLSKVNLGVVQIDTRIMPSNYSWREITFGGDSSFARSMNNPDAVLQDLVGRRNASGSLLDPQFCDLGAVIFATAYVVGMC